MIAIQTQKLRDQYRLVRDSFTGQGGYADNSYLVKFDSEQDFDKRASESAYTNLLGPIVEARVDPCFVQEPTRTYNSDILLEEFLENADNNGTPLEQIIHEATLNTVLLGNDIIVMDNFPIESDMSLEEVVDSRKFPYIYRKSVTDIYSFELDPWGKLLEITFYWGPYNPADKDSNVYLFKRFTKTDISMVTMNRKKDKNSEYDPETSNTVTISPHNFGKCPVVYYNVEVLPFSKYYSMARQSKHLFNSESRLGELNKDQNLSVLAIQGRVPEGGLDIGASNALIVDDTVKNMPEFISPDSSQMTVSVEYVKSLKEGIIQSADVLGTSAASGGSNATSGAQEAYRFFGKAAALMNSSVIASYLDENVVELLEMFMGTSYDYEVKYKDEFAPTFSDTKLKYDVLEKVIGLNISDKLNSQIGKDIASLVGGFMGWDCEVINDVLSSFDAPIIPAPAPIADPEETMTVE